MCGPIGHHLLDRFVRLDDGDALILFALDCALIVRQKHDLDLYLGARCEFEDGSA
jgi:hypothetical protein